MTTPLIRAGMDIGTNTFLLLVAEVENGVVKKVLRDETRIVRLGQGVDQARSFHPDAMARGKAVFSEFGEILKQYPGVNLRAVATSGSRDAANSRAYFDSMRPLLGFPVEVISGEEEARLSFRGALCDRKDHHGDYAVIDIGGGSTEIVAWENPRAALATEAKLIRKSFDMGCVRMTERFQKHDPALSDELHAIREHVRGVLHASQDFLERFRGRKLLGVAGTATYLSSAALGLDKFSPDLVHGSVLSLKAIEDFYARVAKISSRERLGIGGMDSGRADVIVAGTIILEEFLRALHADSLGISIRGLRYGLVL